LSSEFGSDYSRRVCKNYVGSALIKYNKNMIFRSFPYPSYRRLRHIAIVWFIETIALYLLGRWLPGLYISSEFDAFLAVTLIGLLNAILRPLILQLTMTITVLTLGLFSFFLNIIMVVLVAYIMPGFNFLDYPSVLYVVLGISFINILASNILALDENDSYYRAVIPKIKPKGIPPESQQSSGLVIIEIDGLAYPVIEKAIELGYMPTLQNFLSTNYQIHPWNSGLPSQTSASQLGILYGENKDIPAFRWYDKEKGKLVVSNHPSDTEMIEKSVNQTNGLLYNNSSSIGNMFSGNAERSVLTMSKLSDIRKIPGRSGYFYNFFVNPYNFIHTFLLVLLEFVREIYQSASQMLDKHTLRIRRTFLFALERALSAVLIRELTTHLLIEEMFRGRQTIYATYFGYDVVAHHTGTSSPGALRTLRDIDKQIQRVHDAIKQAPRQYEVVLISDHGLSQGPTFEQKYHMSLETLIDHFLDEKHSVYDSGASDETKGYVNSLLQMALAPHKKLNQTARRLYEQYKRDRGDYLYFDIPKKEVQKSDIILCLSGSMAMLYFSNYPKKLLLEEVKALFPNLIESLVIHPGIGFVAVDSLINGPVVISNNGMYYLSQQDFEGKNPLALYEDTAPAQLLKLFSYSNVGDLVIQSRYDPATDQIPAFENLIAHHGGLGGDQTTAFVMHPTKLPFIGPLDDATKMHNLLKSWQFQLFIPD
jgi:putative membrane protein